MSQPLDKSKSRSGYASADLAVQICVTTMQLQHQAWDRQLNRAAATIVIAAANTALLLGTWGAVNTDLSFATGFLLVLTVALFGLVAAAGGSVYFGRTLNGPPAAAELLEEMHHPYLNVRVAQQLEDSIQMNDELLAHAHGWTRRALLVSLTQTAAGVSGTIVFLLQR